MVFRRQPEPEANKPENATVEFQRVNQASLATAIPLPAATKPPAPPGDAMQHLSQVADAMRKMAAEIAELRARNATLEREHEDYAKRMTALREALKLERP